METVNSIQTLNYIKLHVYTVVIQGKLPANKKKPPILMQIKIFNFYSAN